MKVLLYSQKLKPEDNVFIDQVTDILAKHHTAIYVNDVLLEYKDFASEYVIDSPAAFKKINPDLVISLGGDGTILKVITLIQDLETPILGINLGRLGFLANVEKHRIDDIINEVLQGNFKTERRVMLQLECNIPIFEDARFALNDFTIHKRDTSSMITIHTYVDDVFLNSYWADGIIVSTPTGSTGYSLSCGGPIIFPTSNNIVITPVAPHNLNVRPVILPDSSKILLKVEGRSENFLSTLDSRYETITEDHAITLTKCHFAANMVMLSSINFMETIREKLLWGLDKRN